MIGIEIKVKPLSKAVPLAAVDMAFQSDCIRFGLTQLKIKIPLLRFSFIQYFFNRRQEAFVHKFHDDIFSDMIEQIVFASSEPLIV